MDISLDIIISFLIAFFSGAIPTGVIISKSFFGFDIRTKGSGNMGSTNVFRILGRKWGIIVQIIDILKGFIPVFFLSHYYVSPDIIISTFDGNIVNLQLLLGLATVLGHIFSPFVSFKGGKGINTATGMLVAISPFDISIAFIVFWLIVFSTGYISLGSLSAGLALPISLLIRHNFFDYNVENYFTIIYFFCFITCLIFFTHKSNIKRLLKGEENRFDSLHLLKSKVKS